MSEFSVRAVYVRPGEQPVIKELENTEAQMEDLVEGRIASTGVDDGVCVIYNALADVLHMPLNRTIYNQEILGPFVVVSFDESGDIISLSEDNIAYYQKIFSL